MIGFMEARHPFNSLTAHRGAVAWEMQSAASVPQQSVSEHSDDNAAALDRARLCVSFVDVVGFSALMHDDEEGTIHKWADLRDEVVLPLLASHDGTLVKLTGDGIFATFADAVSGARWSHEVQRQARQRRQGLALRISINFCHVFRDGSDLQGDGINIAARLQEHAASGGIIITQAVVDEIADHLDLAIRPLGPVVLRKMRKSIKAYELITDGRPVIQRTSQDSEMPSIAVLPFQSLSGETDDEYFSAGLVEDIVTSLSSLRDLTVISRSSTLAFARQAVDPRVVGDVLGVRYMIAGTVRRSPNRIRISTQLLDTETGEQVFSERRDFSEHDMFQVQDEIVESTLRRLMPGLRAAERRRAMRKRPVSFTAYDLYLRAIDLIGSLERADFESAYTYLNQAIERDPSFATALAWLARWHTLRVGQGWSEDPRRDAEQAAECAMRAIRLDEQNALALAIYGHVQSYLFGDYETAITYLDQARATNPNSSTAWLLSSVTLSSLGRNKEAVDAAERALRLSPFDQSLFAYYAFLGIVYYDAGAFEKAISWLSRSLAENPRYTTSLRTLIVALVAAGRIEKARDIAKEFMKLEPGFRISTYRQALRLYQDPAQSEAFRERLRAARIPE